MKNKTKKGRLILTSRLQDNEAALKLRGAPRAVAADNRLGFLCHRRDLLLLWGIPHVCHFCHLQVPRGAAPEETVASDAAKVGNATGGEI